ncbi:MAG: HEAT repeat domain-containing protein [Solirubrobacteraceae bacterium]
MDDVLAGVMGPTPLFARFLLTGLVAVAALLVVLASAIALRRALRLRSERRSAYLAAAVRPILLEMAAEDVPSPRGLALLSGVDQRTWRALEPSVVFLLAQLRGDSRRALADLLIARGAEIRACRHSRSRASVRRAAAADVLGAIGTPMSVEELIRMLDDRDLEVRAAAARALGRIADPSAALPLLAGLTARRRLPSAIVVHGLLRIGTPALHYLLGALDHRQVAIRVVAAKSLGLLGDVRAVERLTEAASRDVSEDVRVSAATALGHIGSSGAVGTLLDASMASQPSALRTAAVLALGEVGDIRTVPQLRGHLDDLDWRVAHAAAAALSALGGGGYRALVEAATDPAAPGCAHALEALALLDLRRARPEGGPIERQTALAV